MLMLSSQALSQTNEDVTLIFKRPWSAIFGDALYSAQITVNGNEACNFETSTKKISTCIYKTDAGEKKIIVSTKKGSIENVFDVSSNKIYTLVVYQRIYQMYDMIFENISSKIIQNKSKYKESNEIIEFTYKALVISID